MVEQTAFGYDDFYFAWGDHICGIFDNRAQQMAVMGEFIASGIRAEQRCVWVSSRESAEALRAELTGLGGDLPTLETSNQLLIISEIDFYLREGVFDPNRTIDLIGTLLEDNQREGYAVMRLANDVSWLSQGRVDTDVWESFEARLTQEVARLPLVMVCQYGRRQLSGDLIVTALRTHTTVILGDTFRRNPFYVPFTGAGTAEIV